jgi:hypothetical protein
MPAIHVQNLHKTFVAKRKAAGLDRVFLHYRFSVYSVSQW